MGYLISISLTRPPRAAGRFGPCLARGREVYRRFHCFPAPRIYRLRCPRRDPAVQVDLGELRGLIYRSARGPCARPRTFVHFFERPAQLTCDPTGRQLYIQGGNYRVTRRGIEG